MPLTVKHLRRFIEALELDDEVEVRVEMVDNSGHPSPCCLDPILTIDLDDKTITLYPGGPA